MKQMNSVDLQPLISLLKARGQGLLKSALDGDVGCTNTYMRALTSALVSRRAEVEIIGKKTDAGCPHKGRNHEKTEVDGVHPHGEKK
jgi:hypothetical protein